MNRVFAIRSVVTWFALAVMLMLAATPAQAQVVVNGVTISAQQINARAGLLRLEGRGASDSARRSMAINELIDDQIKLQEAARLGLTINEGSVDQAVQSIAANMRVSTSNLQTIFSQNGVSFSTLRDRLRAALAWQGVVQRAVSSRVTISELDLDLRAAEQVREVESFDYILREVIFGTGSGGASRRTGEANQYRSRFTGCDTAVDLVLQYNDAVVVEVGRRHGSQFPDAIANELAGLNVGQLTQPRVTDRGVSMYAICEKAAARDLTFIRNDLRQEAGNEALQAEAEAYLAELRAAANIQR